MKLGYACINMTLAKRDIRANRTLTKKTFDTRGLEYVSEVITKNVTDLLTIVRWNVEHGISAYRIPDDLFPWKSHYEITELPGFDRIRERLLLVGNFCRENGHRLSMHPGPFNVLASDNDAVVNKTILELNKHSQIFDIMGYEADNNTKINIHVGTTKGEKEVALNRFCDAFDRLDENTKKRLTVENDDKPSMYTVQDLVTIHERCGIPIVFDYHHHSLNQGGHTQRETLELAISTWPEGITPTVHMSSPKPIYEKHEGRQNPRAHADYVYESVNTYDNDIVVMLESKAKELSVLKYVKDYLRS